jgi:hypothetical protein
LQALEAGGLVEVRRMANSYKVEIIDKGLSLHRHCMALMRQAASEQPLPTSQA